MPCVFGASCERSKTMTRCLLFRCEPIQREQRNLFDVDRAPVEGFTAAAAEKDYEQERAGHGLHQ
jgi:hypothetical protein